MLWWVQVRGHAAGQRMVGLWRGQGHKTPGPLTPRLVPRFSALHHAALNGNTELISLLLEAQAAVDIKDNKGESWGPGHSPPPFCRLTGG